MKRATQSAPTRGELPNEWEKTTLKYLYHADTFARSSLIRHLRTFSRTPYGHKHGWDTLATQCGRSTPSHAPTEHGTRPTTTWDDYPAMETMHSPAQPRQHASRSRTTGTANTPSDDTHKHWQTTSAPTHTSMMQRVPGRGSTQGMQDISPEPLTPQIPALPHAAARSGCRGAPGSPASPKRLVRAREDGGEDGSPTLVVAHEVE